MIIQLKEIYKCEYCKKLYQIKTACEKHEFGCHKNPKNNRACFDCEHLMKKAHSIYNYDIERTVNIFHCDKIDSFLYPPKVEMKGNAFDIEEPNQPMPKECNHRPSEIEVYFMNIK